MLELLLYKSKVPSGQEVIRYFRSVTLTLRPKVNKILSVHMQSKTDVARVGRTIAQCSLARCQVRQWQRSLLPLRQPTTVKSEIYYLTLLLEIKKLTSIIFFY